MSLFNPFWAKTQRPFLLSGTPAKVVVLGQSDHGLSRGQLSAVQHVYAQFRAAVGTLATSVHATEYTLPDGTHVRIQSAYGLDTIFVTPGGYGLYSTYAGLAYRAEVDGVSYNYPFSNYGTPNPASWDTIDPAQGRAATPARLLGRKPPSGTEYTRYDKLFGIIEGAGARDNTKHYWVQYAFDEETRKFKDYDIVVTSDTVYYGITYVNNRCVVANPLNVGCLVWMYKGLFLAAGSGDGKLRYYAGGRAGSLVLPRVALEPENVLGDWLVKTQDAGGKDFKTEVKGELEVADYDKIVVSFEGSNFAVFDGEGQYATYALKKNEQGLIEFQEQEEFDQRNDEETVEGVTNNLGWAPNDTEITRYEEDTSEWYPYRVWTMYRIDPAYTDENGVPLNNDRGPFLMENTFNEYVRHVRVDTGPTPDSIPATMTVYEFQRARDIPIGGYYDRMKHFVVARNYSSYRRWGSTMYGFYTHLDQFYLERPSVLGGRPLSEVENDLALYGFSFYTGGGVGTPDPTNLFQYDQPVYYYVPGPVLDPPYPVSGTENEWRTTGVRTQYMDQTGLPLQWLHTETINIGEYQLQWLNRFKRLYYHNLWSKQEVVNVPDYSFDNPDPNPMWDYFEYVTERKYLLADAPHRAFLYEELYMAYVGSGVWPTIEKPGDVLFGEGATFPMNVTMTRRLTFSFNGVAYTKEVFTQTKVKDVPVSQMFEYLTTDPLVINDTPVDVAFDQGACPYVAYRDDRITGPEAIVAYSMKYTDLDGNEFVENVCFTEKGEIDWLTECGVPAGDKRFAHCFRVGGTIKHEVYKP